MYPPELLRERPIGSATGSFIVATPSEAPGDDSFPAKARAGDSDRTTVSTAVITVEGPTGIRPVTGSPSEQNSAASPSRGSNRNASPQETG